MQHARYSTTPRRHARLTRAAGAAAAALLAACTAREAPTAPRATALAAAVQPAPTGPTTGVAVGVAIESAPLGRPGMSAWDSWTSLVGRRASYVMWFTDWSTNFQGFAVTNAYSRNATPVITWEMKNRNAAITYADVLAHKWDKYIDTWAAAAAADGRPIVLRFGHEMNGNWYGWSGASNGASAAAAANFVLTWKYVRARFAAAKATNVAWAWCPNHESVPAAPWNTVRSYYPGDAEVEWVCADGYNWGTSQTLAANGWDSKWMTFDQVFRAVYDSVTAVAPGKPFMIGEYASSEVGGNKADWIRSAAASMKSYPRLHAFVWFNYNKETDWRIESSAAATSAFKSAFTTDPFFVWAP